MSWNSFQQHRQIPPNLEVTDEVLERTAGTDINNVWVSKLLFFFFCLWPFFLPVESINFSPAGSSSLWRCLITWMQSWSWLIQVKNKPFLLSPADFFNDGKPELLFKAVACWHYLFMFKSKGALKGGGVAVCNSFPASDFLSLAQTHFLFFLF